jgi:hypothetical protein
MRINQVADVLRESDATFFVDSCNPSLTMHAGRDGTTIDADSPNGPWQVIGYELDGKGTRKFSEIVNTKQELRRELKKFGIVCKRKLNFNPMDFTVRETGFEAFATAMIWVTPIGFAFFSFLFWAVGQR